MSSRILAGSILKADPSIGRLQALGWPVWRRPAPPLEPRPDQIAVEILPLTWEHLTQRPGAFVRELGRMIARGFWETGWPCCCAHRYGHGWTTYDRIPLHVRPPSVPAVDGEHDLRAAETGLTEIPDGALVTRVTDRELIVCLGPAACPTCGRPPRKKDRQRWLDHVARHR